MHYILLLFRASLSYIIWVIQPSPSTHILVFILYTSLCNYTCILHHTLVSYIMSGSSAVTPSSAYLTPLTPGSAKGAYSGAGGTSVADNVSKV